MSKRKPTLQHLSIDRLTRGKYQPRQHFDPEKLQELADAIKSTDGLLQPVVVRPLPNQTYEIVAGERRWRAAQLAGITDIACLIYDYTDEQALQASIIENISRQDLNPIEEAKAYQRLIDEFDYLHEEVAASVGKSRAAISNTLRLLKLHPKIQQYMIDNKLSEGHGKILAALEFAPQLELAEKAIARQWSVRKMEVEAKKIQLGNIAPSERYADVNLQRLETQLSEHLGNRVHVEYEERGGGSLKIRFNNIDELEGHFAKIGFELES